MGGGMGFGRSGRMQYHCLGMFSSANIIFVDMMVVAFLPIVGARKTYLRLIVYRCTLGEGVCGKK
jgi:hypothetical protein